MHTVEMVPTAAQASMRHGTPRIDAGTRRRVAELVSAWTRHRLPDAASAAHGSGTPHRELPLPWA